MYVHRVDSIGALPQVYLRPDPDADVSLTAKTRSDGVVPVTEVELYGVPINDARELAIGSSLTGVNRRVLEKYLTISGNPDESITNYTPVADYAAFLVLVNYKNPDGNGRVISAPLSLSESRPLEVT